MTTSADPELVTAVNQPIERLFRAEVRQKDLDQQLKDAIAVLIAKHAATSAEITQEIESAGAELKQVIKDNRPRLFERGKKSFATMIAIIQLRDVPARLNITDAKLIMSIARRLGVVKKIAKLSIEWKFNADKFRAWLDQHDEYRDEFVDAIEDVAAYESLTLKPNNTHLVYYDGKRISPPPITVH